MRFSIAMLLALMLTPLASAQAAAMRAGPAAISAVAHHTTLMVHIPDMRCEECAGILTATLARRPEVAAVRADIGAQTLIITLKCGRALPAATLRHLVQQSGFHADSITTF